MQKAENLECPQCGIRNSDRKEEYRIVDSGFGMVSCPICGTVWKPLSEEGEDDSAS